MTEAHIFVSGFVQGVGFRHFIISKARALGLKGWVKNLPDGRVEVLVQGNKEKTEQLIKFCEQGPFLAEVKNVVVEWEVQKQKFQGFETL